MEAHASKRRPRAAADHVASLPTDKSSPSRNEIDTVDTIFTPDTSKKTSFLNEIKESALIMIVIFIVCLPQVDALLQRFIPMTQASPYIGILIKSVVAALIVWMVRYFYLSRKG